MLIWHLICTLPCTDPARIQVVENKFSPLSTAPLNYCHTVHLVTQRHLFSGAAGSLLLISQHLSVLFHSTHHSHPTHLVPTTCASRCALLTLSDHACKNIVSILEIRKLRLREYVTYMVAWLLVVSGWKQFSYSNPRIHGLFAIWRIHSVIISCILELCGRDIFLGILFHVAVMTTAVWER